MSMPDYFEEACEQIDAAVFSGDILYNDEAIEKFEEYMGRWKRAMWERAMQKINELKS